MWTGPITERRVQAVLSGGFILVFVLLLAASVFGMLNLRSIRLGAGSLVAEQRATMQLLSEVEAQRPVLSAIFHRLSEESKTELERAAEQFPEPSGRLGEGGGKSEPAPAERKSEQGRDDAMGEIFSRLIAASFERAKHAERQIQEHSRNLVRQSIFLFGGCILLAIASTVFTIRITRRLFATMAAQANELSRVSWQMLERQESAARRFSHELHDELGQTMTALKANIIAFEPASEASRERREDCLHILDEAVQNVRELSQLLRPTTLDDFGLDAALKLLCERFTMRTGIHVDYHSSLSGRVPEETETHLFRIGQEALTNVARHSDAKHVSMGLLREKENIVLRISDDGKGLPPGGPASAGLGMVGMRARARSVKGDIVVGPSPEGGVEIVVKLPATLGTENAEKNPGLVSR
jgi:signal transduction histidine kinase